MFLVTVGSINLSLGHRVTGRIGGRIVSNLYSFFFIKNIYNKFFIMLFLLLFSGLPPFSIFIL